MKRTAAAASLLGLASAASATWSIILVDLRTGEVALGSATCLTGFDLRANTPVLLTGIGGATAQSFVDNTGQNRVFIRDGLARGTSPADILAGLSTFDPGHQTRQYGIVDAQGRRATFSGTGAGAWAGGQTGQFNYTHAGQSGDVAYAIQGNVLTGPCVVDAAVLAAINSPGDLPARLMAAMEAARAVGGDGRCSCTAGGPTACGCPPVTFTKSSHIAYMMIARAGDRDGSTGIYRAAPGPFGLAAADLNGDSRLDFVTAGSTGNVGVMLNTTPPGNPFGMLGAPTTYPAGAGARDIAIADLTGDARPDLVVTQFSANSIGVFPGQPGGTFGARVDTPVSGGPENLAVADFDGANGLDVAVAHTTGGSLWVMLNNGTGGLSIGAAFAAGTDPRSIVAADLVGDARPDLAVCARGANLVRIFPNTGGGTFGAPIDFPAPNSPSALVARDLDGDTDIDLAYATQASPFRAGILLNQGGGVFQQQVVLLSGGANSMGVGDVDGDLKPDLVLAINIGRISVLRGLGGGQFAGELAYNTTSGPVDLVVADHTGDARPDVALTSPGTQAVLLAHNLGDGTFTSGVGTGAGDYFMNFNVALTSGTDPDPVATLQSMFATWRSDLTGRPDAAQSLAAVAPPSVPSGGGASIMTLTLRDWQGQAITAPVNGITVTHATGSAGASQIGPVTPQGGGVYQVALTAGAGSGADKFNVRVDDGLRPVTLMPQPRLLVTGACYADCNGDGQLNLSDFGCFTTRFALGNMYADCNADGVLNLSDFGCYTTKFALGCP